MELTKYGKIFSSYITKGFDEIENGEKTIRKLSRNDSGMIDFAFLYILGANFVPRLLSNFLKLETSKNISFSLKQNNSRVIVENLKRGIMTLPCAPLFLTRKKYCLPPYFIKI